MDVLCPVVVGRDAELALLLSALAGVRDRAGQVVFLTGEPGIGKSRLAREVGARARARGAGVASGRAVPAGVSTPYRPLTEALLQALRGRPTPSDPSLEPWLPTLSAIVPGLAGGASGPAGRRGGGERGRAEYEGGRPASELSAAISGEAVIGLLRLIAPPEGLVLVLEDLHWADPDTLAVLEYLADNLAGQPVLCVATCRSEPPTAAMEMIYRLHARRAAPHVPLARLGAPQVEEMIRACVPGAGQDVVARVSRAADGVPFLVEEVLASPGVPESFRDTVRARLAEGGDEDRLVLQAAAVLGRHFDWRLLPDVTGLGADSVARGLERGVERLLLAVDQDAFRFRHALTREAVADSLLPPRRAALASAALAAVSAAHPDLPGPWRAVAADLAVQAGDLERAGALLAESGTRSLERGALATAVDTLRRAAGMLSPGPERIAAQTQLVEALALAGRVDEAMTVGGALIASLGGDGGPSDRQDGPADKDAGPIDRQDSPADRNAGAASGGNGGAERERRSRPPGGEVRDAPSGNSGLAMARARVHVRLAQAAVAATRWPLAAGHLEAARELLERGVDPELSARAAVLEAESALAGGDPGRARRLAAGVLASGGAAPESRCHALEVLGRSERLRNLGAAREAFEQALEIAEGAGLAIWRLRALHELGTIELYDHAGTRRLAQARRTAAELGALSTAAVLDLQLAAAADSRFEPEDARRHAADCLAISERLGLEEVRAKALYFLAESHAMLRERERSEHFLSLALAAAPGDLVLEAFGWGGCRGMLALLEDDQAGAMRAFERAAEILRGGPPAEPASFRGVWLVMLAASGAAHAASEREAAERSGMTAAFANRGMAHYADAILAGRAGDAERASAVAEAAEADLAPYPVWADLGRMLAAQAALADGWGSPERWLREARQAFAGSGLDRLAQRCDALLAEPSGERWSSFGVTAREADVLRLVAQGLANKQIAAQLFLSPRTVEKHVESLLRKTGARSRTQLVAIAGQPPAT